MTGESPLDADSPRDEAAPLSLSDQVAIDSACDRLEAAWREGASPLVSDHAREGLARSPLGGWSANAQSRLIESLALLDLEYRWRHLAASCEPPDRLPWRARLEDYSARLGEIALLAPWPARAIAEEFRVRMSCGDSPRRDEYRRRFSDAAEAIARAIDRVLVEAHRHEMRVFARGQIVWIGELPARLEIGRQRTGDPRPVAMRSLPGGERLVIAEPNERTLSRVHASIEIESNGNLRIVNRSAKNGIACRRVDASFAAEILAPGAETALEAPLLMGLGDQVVRIARVQ